MVRVPLAAGHHQRSRTSSQFKTVHPNGTVIIYVIVVAFCVIGIIVT